jgi:O-antigen ligase
MEQLQNFLTDWRMRLIALTVAAILAAGASGLLYPSTYAPLIFLGAVGAAVVIVFFLWKPELALYSALLVVLLPGGLLPAGLHSLLNRGLTLLAFGVWCFDLLFRRRKVTLTVSSVLDRFILWSVLTLLWAEHTGSAITTIQTYVMRLLLFFVLIPNEIKTKEKLDGLLRTVAWIGWILVLSSIFMLLREGYTPGTRFKLFDTNENAIGALALVASLGVLWLATHRSTKFLAKALPSFYIIFMIGLIGISGSRGSILSLAIALLALSYGRLTRTWAKISLVIILVILLVAPTTFLTTFERFTENSNDNLAMLGGRAALWQAAWQVILDHMFTGVGIGGASSAIMPYLWMVSAAVGRDSVHIIQF